jgi:hypothetical protein
VTAVETALRTAEAEAQRRLRELLDRARANAAAEKDASLRRLSRWLDQGGARAAERGRVLDEEARLHDQVLEALGEARLELDQAALVQLL